MLTLENLKEYPPGIFAYGSRILYANPDSKYADDKFTWQKWVAVRGQIHDWAIYRVEGFQAELDMWSFDYIAQMGDKLHSMLDVQELVSCNKEALDMYRH